MNVEDAQVLTILGPGTLGLSLAQRAAEQGFLVRLVGKDLTHARAGIERVRRYWESSRTRGRLIQAQVDEAVLRVAPFPDLPSALEGADIFLEALPEYFPVKVAAWRSIAGGASQDILWATGSSGTPVSELRSASGFPCPILGFHLFVPVHHHRVVELVSEAGSSPLRAYHLAAQLGLEVVLAPDQPGYLATRLGLIQGLAAMRLVDADMGSPQAIDALMTKGYGHPTGPLELSDRVGLDLRLAIALDLFQRTGDPAFEPPRILQTLVSEGHLGRKSGQGFYRWIEGKPE